MPQFELATLDLVMVGLYVVFIVAVGFYFARRTETTDDYFLAGRSLTWWLIGFSLFASNVSSSTLVGLSSAAFSSGIAVYNYEWMAALVLIVFIIFFLPFYLKTQVFTMPEFLERRFDERSRYYFSALMIFMNIVIDTAAALYAGALVVQIVYPNIPLWVSVVILGILAGIYTIAGGLKAVVYTDAVQAVLLLIGAFLVAVLSFNAIGGSWDAVKAAVPEQDLSIILPASDPVMPWPGLLTGVFLLGFYFWGTNQFMVQRTLGAKDLNPWTLGRALCRVAQTAHHLPHGDARPLRAAPLPRRRIPDPGRQLGPDLPNAHVRLAAHRHPGIDHRCVGSRHYVQRRLYAQLGVDAGDDGPSSRS